MKRGKYRNGFGLFIIPDKYKEMMHALGERGVTKFQNTFVNVFSFVYGLQTSIVSK
jgi:hypothetical protein